MKPGFSTVYIGTISFAIYIAIASVMAFQRGELFSYGMQLAKVCDGGLYFSGCACGAAVSHSAARNISPIRRDVFA